MNRIKLGKIFVLTMFVALLHSVSALAQMGPAYFKGNRDFQWPVDGYYKLSSCYYNYDYDLHKKGGHHALDIPAPEGTIVRAAYDGEVVESRDTSGGWGKTILIKHDYNGRTLYTRYSHLSNRFVDSGHVNKGQKIGATGDTDAPGAYHLDFSVTEGMDSVWRNVARDPFACELLEMPSGFGISQYDGAPCCFEYEREVKELYSKPKCYNPEGAFEFASGGYGMIRVKGYAFDRDNLAENIKVHIYIDGVYAGEWIADNLRTDLSEVGDNHGFDFPVYTTHTGEHTVSAYAINIGEGKNTLLGSRTVTLQAGYSPQGAIGSIVGGEGNIKLEGWVFDRDDLDEPLEIHIYADGYGVDHWVGKIVADYCRNDLPSAFEKAGVVGLSPYHGFNTFMNISLVGRHEIFLTAINIGTGENISLGSKTVNITPINHNPRGAIGEIEGGEGNIYVKGWAFDRDALDDPLEIHVYADGYGIDHWVGKCMADRQRRDLPEGFANIGILGVGEYHGFNTYFQTDLEGTHEIFITAINIGTGENISLGSKTVNITPINHNPRGAIEEIEGSEGSIYVKGWAFDRDALDDPLEIHVYADGYGIDHWVGKCMADRQRRDLPEGFANIGILGVGEYHGFNTYFQTDLEGTHEIFITAINIGTGENISLGSRTVYITPNSDHEPKGCIDEYELDESGFSIAGWAYDPDDDSKSIEVEVYVDGKLITTVDANKESLDVNEVKGIQGAHRYRETISYDVPGEHLLELHAVNIGNVAKNKCFHRRNFTLTSSIPHEHFFEEKVTTIPTCDETGIKTFRCSCGNSYTEDIPATGHQNTEVRNSKETSCSEAGYTGDTYCSDCESLISAGEAIAKLDHEYDEGVITTEATCTEDEVKTFTCKHCDASYTEDIPATGHQNTELRNAKETSCAEAGYTGDTYCTDCETMISSGEAIAKLDHEYDEGVISTEAKCIEAGVKTFTCKNCDDSYTEEIPATGHQNTEIRNAKAAQVGVEGYTGDKYCKDCDTLLETGKKIDALPEEHVHSYNSAVTTAPSCSAKGVRTYTCSCGDSYTEEIEKVDHQYDAGIITKKATCSEDGIKTFKCTTCDATYTETVKAEGHIGPEVTKFAKAVSCTVDGYTGDVYCSSCGSMITEGEIISAPGHKWDQGTVVTAANCITDGLKRFSCQNCDATKDETIGATGHGETITKFTKAASCKTEGYTGDLYCKACGEMTKEGSVIEKMDHSWDAGTITTVATCIADGSKSFTCTTCGTAKVETVSATGHGATEVKNAKAATCTTAGYTGDTCCKACGVVIKKGSSIAKVAHKWDAGKITTQPTTTKPGVKTFTCSVCKGTKTEDVPVIVPPTVMPGKTVKDTKTNGYYVVLKDGVSVRFTKPVSKKATVVIPDVLVIDGVTCKVAEIGEKAFYKNTTVTSIKIGANVTVIGKNAFNGCKNLKKVTGAGKVVTISTGAFSGCAKLTGIPLAGTLTTIGAKAFYGCSVLPKITIPSKVKSIGKQAFYNCKKLKTIVIKTTLLTSKNVGASAFTGTYKTATVGVLSKVLKSYKSLLKAKGMSKNAKYSALK